MSIDAAFRDILSAYDLGGEAVSCEPVGDGHIHDTYRVEVGAGPGARSFTLQRINTAVFRDPDGLMRNIAAVCDYLADIVRAEGGDPARETLSVVRTKDGELYRTDASGGCWRVYPFVRGAAARQSVDSPDVFRAAGAAFGRFQARLADYPIGTLVDTIPRFHDTPDRYRTLLAAVDADSFGRARLCAPEIGFARAHASLVHALQRPLESGELPLAVTHGDTKLNNVLIDDVTGEGVCVIDLDTVMPGSRLYDFGDAIRFGASTAAEDETDLDKVRLSLPLFEAFASGYLRAAGAVLTPLERELMPKSAEVITLECGMRFLTDYLCGDTYFKTHRDGHNLDRARAQFRLLAEMEAHEAEMESIVRECGK